MTEETSATPAPEARRRLWLDVSPERPRAGADVSVVAKASCSQGCDLRGNRVVLRDSSGATVAGAEITETVGEEYATREFSLTVPANAGNFTYIAELLPHARDEVRHEGESVEVPIVVEAHALEFRTWEVPSAIGAGEEFSFKVGGKCLAGCAVSGREFTLHDHEGHLILTGQLGSEPWAGTSAVYFAEVAAQAPTSPGDYRWKVELATSDTPIQHAVAEAAFLVRVVGEPDHTVEVAAIDHEKQSPIKGAHVYLHPYRAFTDENGKASLKVAAGSYQLFVTGFDYIGFKTAVDVTADVSIVAEMVVEKEIDPYDAMP